MPPTPYRDALAWINQVGDDTGGGSRLAKLLLSLYNSHDFPISVADCIDGGIDHEGRELALAMLRDYAERGECEELRQVGAEVVNWYPGFREICEAMVNARQEVRRRWEREREQEAEREEREERERSKRGVGLG